MVNEIIIKAYILLEEVQSALQAGVKHYRKSDNKLLETPKDIIEALLKEKEILLEPKKEEKNNEELMD